MIDTERIEGRARNEKPSRFFLFLLALFGTTACDSIEKHVLGQNAAPVISHYGCNPRGPVEQHSLQCSTEASDPDGGNIPEIAVKWFIGSPPLANTPVAASGRTVVLQFNSGGTKTIYISATDDEDTTTTVPFDVSVPEKNRPPVPTIVSTRLESGRYLLDACSVSDEDGDYPVHWRWNFGDRTTEASRDFCQVEHTFGAPWIGRTVVLSVAVTDNRGAEGSKLQPLSVE